MASIDSRRAKCCMSNAMGWLSSRPQPEPEREPELEPIDGREILIVCLNHKQRRSRKKEKKQKKQKRGIQIKTSQDKNPAVGSPRPVGIRSRSSSSSSSSKWEDYAGYFLVVQSTVNHQLWGLASRHVTLSLSLSLLTLTSHTLHRHFAATQH